MEKLEYEGLKSYRSFIECFDMGELDFFNLPDAQYFELTDYFELHKLKKEFFQNKITSFLNRIKSINKNISGIVPTFNKNYPLGIIFNNNKAINLVNKEGKIWNCPICNCNDITIELNAIYDIFLDIFKDEIKVKTASEYFTIEHGIDNNIIKYEDVPILYIDDECNILNNKQINKSINDAAKEKGYKTLNKNESKNLIKKLYIKA